MIKRHHEEFLALLKEHDGAVAHFIQDEIVVDVPVDKWPAFSKAWSELRSRQQEGL